MIGMQPFVTGTMLILLTLILLKALKVIRHEAFVVCLKILAYGYGVFLVLYVPTLPVDLLLMVLAFLGVMFFFYLVFNRR